MRIETALPLLVARGSCIDEGVRVVPHRMPSLLARRSRADRTFRPSAASESVRRGKVLNFPGDFANGSLEPSGSGGQLGDRSVRAGCR